VRLHVQITNAALPSNQPDATQLFNSTYLLSTFEGLLSSLEAPILLAEGTSVFSYAPCYVNVDPGGA
jgi:hypothetical protein